MSEETAIPHQKRKLSSTHAPTVFIDAFVDFAFKRLFDSDESKPILIGLLNHILRGRKYINSIEYDRNDNPGENAEEGGAVFDVICTDIDGSEFIIEVQRGYQKHFKDRALFYASRAISRKAPKGGRRKWGYELSEVYLIAFLEDFALPDSSRSEYVRDICLANRYTGEIFGNKLNLIFVELLNFVKRPHELNTDLDKWLYALKHLAKFDKQPAYLIGSEFDQLFNIAKYTNLNKEEQEMYNRSLKYKWDNQNVRDYAEETGLQRGLERGMQQGIQQGLQQGIQQGRLEGLAKGEHKNAVAIALRLKDKGMTIEEIAEITTLSVAEIEAL